jgi:hypothetical protein
VGLDLGDPIPAAELPVGAGQGGSPQLGAVANAAGDRDHAPPAAGGVVNLLGSRHGDGSLQTYSAGRVKTFLLADG